MPNGRVRNIAASCKLQGRRVMFVIEKDCYLLPSTEGKTIDKTLITNLCSSQEEADTRIILHLKQITNEELFEDKTPINICSAK